MHERHGHVIDDLVLDLLRTLASPDLEVRRKCLKIAMEMVSARNVNDVVSFLKKEITKTRDDDQEKVARFLRIFFYYFKKN